MTPREQALHEAKSMIASIKPNPVRQCTVRRTPWIFLNAPIGIGVDEMIKYADRKHAEECETCKGTPE